MNKDTIDINTIRGNKMPDLRIQTNIDNGDLPEQLELFEEYDSNMKMWKAYLRLFNILDKKRLKEFLKELNNK